MNGKLEKDLKIFSSNHNIRSTVNRQFFYLILKAASQFLFLSKGQWTYWINTIVPQSILNRNLGLPILIPMSNQDLS